MSGLRLWRLATATLSGIVSTAAQTFAGVKTFNDGIVVDDAANQSALNYYRFGTQATTFTSDGTSGGTSSSVDIQIQRIGDWVTIFIPAFSAAAGTGNPDTYNNDTALPSWARPGSASNGLVGGIIRNNGGSAGTPAYWQISSLGTVSMLRDFAGTDFTTSANAGLQTPASLTYYVGTGS